MCCFLGCHHQVKKVQDKVSRCQAESEKAKERYEKSLDELTTLNPRYMEDMGMQVCVWQQRKAASIV